MARDCSIDVRRFVVEAFKADAEIAAIVEDRVYGPQAATNPAWPFIRIDSPPAIPEFDGCSDASGYRFNAHGFAKGDDERSVAILGKHMARVVDDLEGKIADAPDAFLTKETHWTGTQTLSDIDEANGWHAVVGIEAHVSAE